ncbi:hypothetical protein [Vulgatibacter incomptus]|uniref:Amidinotransferase n=1 Tax=Vulgatibacter incomptus TaxID=1391653 RepID=A0A0K1P9K8_9BACT|nr:hypothetical protein [Vulgatibacter incomptus]AKU90203.1 hypothetical protein AKJ08_0590 [Vulgatibacter incomptus]
MSNALRNVYGPLLAVRPPVAATLNKAGANYKSEVTFLEYSPREAYDEWLRICEGIVDFGGDAIFDFEAEDEPFLGKGDLRVEADGTIRAEGGGEALGNMDEILTGRVFAANGPWVVVEGRKLRALMPNMLTHRLAEQPYYLRLLESMAEAGGYELSVEANPHRWEGMADVAVVGEKVVLTYTVSGHYDGASGPKTMRSSREGVERAADFAGVPEDARVFAELVYPHFHGDTVHFGARPGIDGAKLVHYPGGLWGEGSARVESRLGAGAIVPIGRDDAVEKYAGNSRQVENGVLVPDGVSAAFVESLESLGLRTLRVPLFELFGKAGGGPACATLYLPKNLELPPRFPLRFSVRREEALRRRDRLPEKLSVDPAYFEGRRRG